MDSTHSTDKDTADRMTGRFNGLDHGLYRRFCIYGASAEGGAMLDSRAWNGSVQTSWDTGEFEPVGTCRHCGHDMRPLPTEQVGHITWYTAECVNCHSVVASPNREILRRSGRWSEQPSGFMANRAKGPRS